MPVPARERRLERLRRGTVPSGLLSVAESASLLAVGLRQVGDVMGAVSMSVPPLGFFGGGFPPGWAHHLAEFIAVGTAVQADTAAAPARSWRTDAGLPFTSDLSGQDFWTLLQTGHAPLGMVMGSCVYHVAHRAARSVIANVATNAELPTFTQALYDARELAMTRMQHEAQALRADGIIGVHLDNFSHIWEGHTTEFFAIGTAVRAIDGTTDFPRPLPVLPLDG